MLQATRPVPLRFAEADAYVASAENSGCVETLASALRFRNMVRGYNRTQCTELDRAHFRAWLKRMSEV
jgi:hypothetical protein